MRFNLKVAWFILCVLVSIIILSLWNRCDFLSIDWDRKHAFNKPYHLDQIGENQIAREIDCDINNEYTISCRKEGDEVYIPFTFLHSYFEVRKLYFYTLLFSLKVKHIPVIFFSEKYSYLLLFITPYNMKLIINLLFMFLFLLLIVMNYIIF